MEQYNMNMNASDQICTSHPITHLLSVAVVSKEFRRLLLTDPERALDEGHRGEQFQLTPADRKRILMTHAQSLEELAAQLIQATDEQVEEESIPLQTDSAMPLYQQLYTHLQQSIERGTLEAGAQLPSERRVATEYGIRFSSGIINENIAAFQFHPEKSGRFGLKMLENFIYRFG